MAAAVSLLVFAEVVEGWRMRGRLDEVVRLQQQQQPRDIVVFLV